MEKVFYGIVTQYDCPPEKASAEHPANGPIIFECLLNEFAQDEARVRSFAETGFKQYGWVRVAKITVDIPGE